MVEKSKRKNKKLKGVMKGLKRKPKPGSYDYQLQETMKPIYKTPPAMKKGKLAKKKGLPTPLVKGSKDFFKDVGKFPGIKPKKKMGGGLTEATRRLRAQGLRTGGMCRGMGAAIRGGDFKGVK